MANVIYNLENTRFKVRLEEYPDYIFFFSSVFHQNKFLKGYKDFIENVVLLFDAGDGDDQS